jgi:branched-chain amino acid transport system substrate-binding protein
MALLNEEVMSEIEANAQRPATERPLRFGASLSLTGSDYALQGGYMKEGYLLFQQRANDAEGILGKPVEFVIYDDASNPATAVKNYQRLIADGIDVLLGPYGSTMTEAMADLMEESASCSSRQRRV